MSASWSTMEEIEAEFPSDKYQHHRITSEDEGRMVAVMKVATSGRAVTGETRWLGPTEGILVFTGESEPICVPLAPRKTWWSRLMGLFRVA